MIHFEYQGFVIFCFLFFLHMGIQLFCTICWKDYPFSIEFPLLLCQRLVDYICMDLLLGSLLGTTDILSILLLIPCCFNCCYIIESLEISNMSSPNIIFLYNSILLVGTYIFLEKNHTCALRFSSNVRSRNHLPIIWILIASCTYLDYCTYMNIISLYNFYAQNLPVLSKSTVKKYLLFSVEQTAIWIVYVNILTQ